MTVDGQLAGGAASDAARERAKSFLGRSILDRYKVEELVALGGLAAVFRARVIGHGKGEDVALKILHPDTEQLPELVDRFKREAIAGRHIYHPNVAAVHEVVQLEDGTWCMVMEYVRGVTLRQLIAQGPMPPMRAAKIARQIAVGLNAAHDMGIIHRDIKPLNVMVCPAPGSEDGERDEVVKVIDFGLARVPVDELRVGVEANHELTQAGVVMGTMAYLAPEAALGMRSIDKRSDLYALGVILYEMLSGKHPFDAATPSEMFAKHRKAPVPPIEKRAPGVRVPQTLETLARKLLEKDPEERNPNARAVIAALEAAMREMEEDATGGFLRGWRIVAAAAGVGLMLAAGVAAYLLAGR
ncbi:serine/threonine-protein kinase [Chondromyces apiculatus]|uniref:Serine/threonine protein kinase n=1 Tax=Chondromyces apiculatus DSM 436 TaxID=1192034 RepID=A0A017THI0_9BACT|nr:serine/threonine-protein kinase [Chondromyces apiculatus]EYF08738.1 serine/threonine protein kinase [Chondromyces apiculatus DSM 436]